MVTREVVEQVVRESGLWDGERRTSHGYILSPDLYEISQEQNAELEALGIALQDCLAGFGEIAAVAHDPKLGNTLLKQKCA